MDQSEHAMPPVGVWIPSRSPFFKGGPVIGYYRYDRLPSGVLAERGVSLPPRKRRRLGFLRR